VGTYVYWVSVGGVKSSVIVQQADQILPCPASADYVNEGERPITVTVAIVGPASAYLRVVPPPG